FRCARGPFRRARLPFRRAAARTRRRDGLGADFSVGVEAVRALPLLDLLDVELTRLVETGSTGQLLELLDELGLVLVVLARGIRRPRLLAPLHRAVFARVARLAFVRRLRLIRGRRTISASNVVHGPPTLQMYRTPARSGSRICCPRLFPSRNQLEL